MINETDTQKKKFEHWQWVSVALVIYDMIAVGVAYLLALLLRFDFRFSVIPEKYWTEFVRTIPFCIVLTPVIFMACKLYKIIWRHFGISGGVRCIVANVASALLYLLGTGFIVAFMPASYYIFGFSIQLFLTSGIRVAYRLVLMIRDFNRDKKGAMPVMIIGAGKAGLMIKQNIDVAREVNETVACFIDDNQNKKGRLVGNTQVYGDRTCIFEAVEKFGIKKIYLAMPSASAEDKRDLLNISKETGCEIKAIKGLDKLHDAEVSLKNVKDVAIEDLLGRETVNVDIDSLLRRAVGKTFMVTGAGGSIGSELSRQIAGHNPKQLILLDIYENSLYEVQLEIRKKFPNVDLVVLVGSIRDSSRLMEIFSKYRPQYVFHAAAHKHVPLLEDSPCEAIKNNSIGTYKTAYAAMASGCEKFVLISTDKAVNPTSYMGASKRICEMVIQTFAKAVRDGNADELPDLGLAGTGMEEYAAQIKENLKNSKTQFAAVRFGNVLGSNGSVVPIFKKQIEEGGPVTVTHPDIIRYFMTIPEAVSLVLDASIFAKDGEICVLDMGEPVKIDTLARNLIKLSGLKPGEDIKIVYTGLRPGEKLYEERLMDEEGLRETSNRMVSVARPIDIDNLRFISQMQELANVVYRGEEETKELVRDIVMTYNKPE